MVYCAILQKYTTPVVFTEDTHGQQRSKQQNGKGRNNLRGILTLVAWALVLTVAFNYFSAYNRNAASKATSP